jgi:hypothetical protein
VTDEERPSRRRLWWSLAALVVLGWAGATAVTLLRARSDVETGLASVTRAQKATAPGDLVDGRPLADLRDSASSFGRAHDRLSGVHLAPLKVLPVLGRQFRSATALAGAAAEVSAVGVDAVQGAQRVLRQPHGSGPQRVTLLRDMGRLAADTDAKLADIDLGPSRALFGALAEKRVEVADRLAEVREGLRDGSVVATGLADLLQGPRRYLVLAANNSEMRAGSGMFLSLGELTLQDGSFALGDFAPAGDSLVPAPPPITDADYAARWGWLNPNREWRNLAVSPRFDATAELASRMWTGLRKPPVDGVLALDPLVVQALLEAAGPVTVAGREVTADNVDDLLLHDQYIGLTSLAGDANAARRELLGLIAKAALGNVEQGGWDMAKMAAGLARVARGRHLLGWASRPEEQRLWTQAGIDGRLQESSLMLSLLNRGANKLDRFLKVDADLSLRPEGEETAAELRVTMTNTTPDGEPPYVTGPYPGSPVGAGDYFGILALNVPGFAGDLASDAESPPAAAGPDGPTRVLGVPVRVDRGQAKTVTFRFRFADPRGALVVEPSARVPAIAWTAPGQIWSGNERRTVLWR